MNLNCFYYSHPMRYYLKHPWKFFRHTWWGFHAMFQRAKRGYADLDVYNFDNFLLGIIPPALRYMAECEVGAYPGVEPYETFEKWQQWLGELANRFEALQEDWGTTRNEYEKDMMAQIDNGTIDPMLREKWSTRTQELSAAQQEEIIAVFSKLAHNFYMLWI